MKTTIITATVLLLAMVSASGIQAQQRIITQGGVQRLAAEVPAQANGQSMQLPSTRYGAPQTRATLPAHITPAPGYTVPRNGQRYSGVTRASYRPANMASDIATSAVNTAYRITEYSLRSQINRGINDSVRKALDF
jgi:hypothetical protein